MPYHMVRLGGDHVQIGQLEGVGKQALVGEEELRLKNEKKSMKKV